MASEGRNTSDSKHYDQGEDLSRARDHLAEEFPLPVAMERRSKVRFPLELRVRFRSLGKTHSVAGIGLVVNMSSGGVLVAYPHEISLGASMELSMEWPPRLDGRVPLQFVAVGTVVRRERFRFAVGLERHHFRTTGGTDLGTAESWLNARKPRAKRMASA